MSKALPIKHFHPEIEHLDPLGPSRVSFWVSCGFGGGVEHTLLAERRVYKYHDTLYTKGIFHFLH